MDNELLDLADRLCTVAGMIMEDNNLLAVTTARDSAARDVKISTLTTAADDLVVLIAAAKVLVRVG